MAGNIFLTSLSICLLILFNGCLAERPQRETQRCKQNQCQINRLEALEPENRIEAEAGMTEVWNNTNRQFQCAGVAFIRRTLERDALLLPSFTNTPQLVYIERGRGYFSAVFPGCPETFQESQEGGEFEQGEGGSFQDEHQKIRHFRNGDIIALPAGVTYWFYNTGDEPLVFVSLLDTSNVANQLDRNPRKFFLGGNPEQEFEQGQRGGSRERQPHRGEKSQCNNLFCGFDEEMLAEAFNVEPELIRRLQNEEDNRGNIVKVEGGLQVTQPPRQWEREQGESEGRSPWYERPGQSRPWYERPGQSRPWYERPGQSRPSYDRPGQSRPSYDRPGQSRPSYDRPGQSRPSYDRPGHERGRPGFERPGHEGSRPGFERPGHEGSRPGFERPGHEGSRPGYERPGHEGGRPGYERPGHEGGRPGYERPGHEGGRPGYERPGHEGGRPGYERPGHEGGRPWYERPGQKGERKPECKRRCEQECGRDNGLEETFCSMRLRENIGDPSRADVFTPRAGRVSTINSHNLPVLNWLQLSAEHGVLYRNAVFVPHWNLNAHSIMYATRGRARIQVVDHRGNSVFDDEIEQGQVLTIPQNFAVMKRAGDEGFEWVSFKTNNNAMINPLAGRTSAIRGLPGDVLRNAFQDLSDEDVQMLKNNRRETTLLSPSGSYERRISAE